MSYELGVSLFGTLGLKNKIAVVFVNIAILLYSDDDDNALKKGSAQIISPLKTWAHSTIIFLGATWSYFIMGLAYLPSYYMV